MNKANGIGRSTYRGFVLVSLLSACLASAPVAAEELNGSGAKAIADQSSWSPTGSLHTARSNHTATMLSNGKVLVAGGVIDNDGRPTASAEIYDPQTATWSVTGSMNWARAFHSATPLADGKVLVVGYDTAELYERETGTWRPAGELGNQGGLHAAVRLQNGKVLVAGGCCGWYDNPLPFARLYDPAYGTWSDTGSPNVPRYAHTLTLLQNGKVLAVGGKSDDGYETNRVEMYDPAYGQWTEIAPLPTAISYHTATLLPSGKVLISGGIETTRGLDVDDQSSVSSAELFDPDSGTWSAGGDLDDARFAHTATLLPSGDVLVAGGTLLYARPDINPASLTSTQAYDAVLASWFMTRPLNVARSRHTATLLPNGKVLAVGGFNGSALASAELYGPALYTPATPIDASYTGVWYDPAQSGHGIFIEVLPDTRLLAYWFTFDPAGTGQSWFGGVGTYSGNSATITDTIRTTGGHWIPGFVQGQVVNQRWGTLRFTFDDASHGRVDFDSVAGYGSGSMSLTRLTRPVAAVSTNVKSISDGAIAPGYTGVWYDPAQSGHGILVEVLPDNQLLAWWFTFNPAGTEQAWFGGVGSYSGSIATIPGVVQSTGGRWFPNFNLSQVVNNPWGALRLEFTDCNHGRVDFDSTRGYGSGSMNLTRLTLPAGVSCP